jgi:tRNA-binding protein
LSLEFAEFLAVDVRVGEITAAALNSEARKPAYVLTVDFGSTLGTRTSSAQLTVRYTPESLIGKRVVAVMNFAPKRIAGVRSEVLVLGVPDANGDVVLLVPDRDVPLGGRMY